MLLVSMTSSIAEESRKTRVKDTVTYVKRSFISYLKEFILGIFSDHDKVIIIIVKRKRFRGKPHPFIKSFSCS